MCEWMIYYEKQFDILDVFSYYRIVAKPLLLVLLLMSFIPSMIYCSKHDPLVKLISMIYSRAVFKSSISVDGFHLSHWSYYSLCQWIMPISLKKWNIVSFSGQFISQIFYYTELSSYYLTIPRLLSSVCLLVYSIWQIIF